METTRFTTVPIEISSQGFPLTDSLRNHIVRRLLRAIGNFERHVTSVAVRVGDMNGPLRGGIDKYCWVRVTTARLGDIQVRNLGANVYAVVNRAGNRIKHTLGRRVGRATAIRRAAG